MGKKAKKEIEEELKEEIKEGAEETKEENDTTKISEDCDSEESTETTSEPSESEKVATLQDKLLRSQAEFENFRRRNEKEKTEMFTAGSMNVLEKILPVLDNFERGLATADDSPFAEGMHMIYKQMVTTLEDIGVTEIKALGETFDPDFHNAVMHEENDEAKEQEITEVMQTGYMYHEKVLRFAMVKVAN